MAVRVHVAIFKPLDKDDAAHWALWLEAPNQKNLILQTEDDVHEQGYSVADPVAERPDPSMGLKETIHCGDIPAEHSFKSLTEIVQRRPVNNNSTTWNCQNWVMDALEALTSKGLDIPRDVKNRLGSKRENPTYSNPQSVS